MASHETENGLMFQYLEDKLQHCIATWKDQFDEKQLAEIKGIAIASSHSQTSHSLLAYSNNSIHSNRKFTPIGSLNLCTNAGGKR